RVFLFKSSSDRVHVRLRLLNCDARLEPADHAEHVSCSHRRPLSAEGHWRPELFLILIEGYFSRRGGPSGINSRRHDAGNCVRVPVQRDGFVDDATIAAKSSLPEGMTQNDDLPFAGLVLLRQKGTAQHWLNAN